MPGGPLNMACPAFFVCAECSAARGLESPVRPDGGEELAKRRGDVARGMV